MAIPEYPITRREQYLDAIATNDTSVLPAEPITRTEQYLDAIARNGGGGGGSGSGVLVVNATQSGNTTTLDKTWQEIHDAPIAVVKSTNEACPSEVIIGCPTGYHLDIETGDHIPEYCVWTCGAKWTQEENDSYFEETRKDYYTSTTDGFPVFIDNGG